MDRTLDPSFIFEITTSGSLMKDPGSTLWVDILDQDLIKFITTRLGVPYESKSSVLIFLKTSLCSRTIISRCQEYIKERTRFRRKLPEINFTFLIV